MRKYEVDYPVVHFIVTLTGPYLCGQEKLKDGEIASSEQFHVSCKKCLKKKAGQSEKPR